MNNINTKRKRSGKKGFKSIVAILLLISTLMPMIPIGSSPTMAAKIPIDKSPNVEFTLEKELDGKYERIDSFAKDFGVEPWHYSGGFWGQRNSKGDFIFKIPDSQVGDNIKKLDRMIQDAVGGMYVDIDYPEKVKQAINDGKKVVVQMKAGRNEIEDYVYDSEKINTSNIKKTSTGISVKLPFKFNFEEDEVTRDIRYYSEFGLTTGFRMPLVKKGYGWNAYAIFSTSSGVRGGSSYWNWGETAEQGKIHPDIIKKDNSGKLLPGYMINVSDGVNTVKKDSSSIRIGEGTFASKGALGLNFYYPFEYHFFVEKDIPPESGKSNIIMKAIYMFEENTGTLVNWIKRDYDPLDPFNIDKQTITKAYPNINDAFVVKVGERYKI